MRQKAPNKKGLRVVIDTNVFLSALITDGNCRMILRFWAENKFDLVISHDIVNEIIIVGKRTVFRKYFSERYLKQLIQYLIQNATLVKIKTKIPKALLPSDPNDIIFVSCLLASKADMLVTGNVRHFLRLKKIHEVLTTKQFLEYLKSDD